VDGAVLHAHGNATNALAVIAHDQVHREVLDEEQAIELQSHAVKRVEDSMAAEGALVDFSLGRTGEGQSERLKLKDNLRG